MTHVIDMEEMRQLANWAATVYPGERRNANVRICCWSMTHWDNPETDGTFDFELYISSDLSTPSMRFSTMEGIHQYLRQLEILYRNFEEVVHVI